MSVVDGAASFNAVSSTKTASYFSQWIGVRPTGFAEIGDPKGNGRFGRRHERAAWWLNQESPADSIEPLDDALRKLLAQFDGRETILDELRPDFDLWFQCHGSSSSVQCGFWLGAPVLQRLGRLGVDSICTVYLDSDDD